jgi:N-sulfoglucosamine sulfohydrolase
MSITKRLRGALGVLILAAVGTGAGTGTGASGAEPAARNIVLVVADDLGRDLGCYGSPVKTPRLDALAREGARFTHAFGTTASCSPSRSVILTGLHNHANGQYGLAHAEHNFHTLPTVASLPKLLRAAGYRTASVGKLHVQPEAVYPFEFFLNDRTPGGARNGAAMAERCREFLAEPSDRPFFLYFCPTDPHRDATGFANRGRYPGITPVTYQPGDVPVPPFLPDQPEVRAELAEYAQSVSRLDQGVGRLLDLLRETNQLDRTLVVFLSDNGIPFPGAKTSVYDPGIHLPLIVRAPDPATHGKVVEAMVSWVDITPTLLDFAGVAPPKAGLQGRSFLPLLDGRPAEGWDSVYASHTFHEVTMYNPMRAIRTRRHKLIWNLAPGLPTPFASDLYGSPTWQGVLARGDASYGQRSLEAFLHRPALELYDLEADPGESHNLASTPEHAGLVAQLRARLEAFQDATRDPWRIKRTHE